MLRKLFGIKKVYLRPELYVQNVEFQGALAVSGGEEETSEVRRRFGKPIWQKKKHPIWG